MTPYYEAPGVTIYHGDCLEVMPELDTTVDLVLADPPYGTTACKWDTVIPLEPMWMQLKRLAKKNGAIIMTASQPFTTTLIASNMEMFKYCWVWEKSISTGFTHCKNKPLKNYEDVCSFSSGAVQHSNLTKNRMPYNPQGITLCGINNKRGSRGFSGSMERANQSNEYITEFTGYPRMIIKIRNEGHTSHPTQKPVALMAYLIRTYTNEGESVLDFTMGSGTTGVACVETNRKFIGIEMEEKYCEIAVNRIRNASRELIAQ